MICRKNIFMKWRHLVMIRSKKKKTKSSLQRTLSITSSKRMPLHRMKSKSSPRGLKKVSKRTTIRSRRFSTTEQSLIKKSNSLSRTRSFTRKMIHAPHVPKILTRIYDRRNSPPPKLKHPRYKKLWTMSLAVVCCGIKS